MHPNIKCACATQFGSGKGGGIEFGIIMLHQAQAWAKETGKSMAILFADLASDLYSVLREILFDTPCSGSHIPWVFAKLQIPPDAADDLTNVVQNVAVHRDAGVSPHLLALIHEINQDTYFTTGHLDDVVQTKTGTPPRLQLSDIRFQLIRCRITKQIHKKLQLAELFVDIAMVR